MKFIKTFFKSIFGLSIGCLIVVLVWYGISYFPYQKNLKNIIQKNRAEIGSNIDQLYSLAVAAESEKKMIIQVARQAYLDLSQSKKNRPSKTVRRLNNMLWYFSIKYTFSKKEIFYLYSHYALFYEKWGINNAAIKIYMKPILDLSIEQQAAIFAMVASPNRYKPGSEHSKKRVEWILDRYKNAHNI